MVNLEDIKKLHKELSEKQSKGQNTEDFLKKFFQMTLSEDGSKPNTARILPGKDDDTEFFARTAIHRVVDEEGNAKNYHCRAIHDEECPLCDLYRALWKEPYGRDEHKELARAIKPRERYYLNVLDRKGDENTPEENVKILSCGIKLFEKIINTMMDEDFGDITDPQTGHDFKFILTKVKGFNNYDQSAPRPKSTPLGNKKQIAAIMDSLHDLQALVKLFEYDDVKKVADALEARFAVNNTEEEPTEVEEKDYIDEVQG